ncbi:MAG: class I SAM-dependent methyltransferase [Bacteroidales bacterium]
MTEKKFNPEKLAMLNNPERLQFFPVYDIKESTELFEPTHIIDVGAGTGLFSSAFAELFPGTRISACDISLVMIEWITEHVVPQYPSIVPVLTEEITIPLTSETADMLFTVNVHHEFEEPIENIREWKRVLKPRGFLVISDWRKTDSKRGPDISIRYTVDQVCEELIRSGFSIHDIFPEVGDNFVVVARKV